MRRSASSIGAARTTPLGYASIPFSETVDLATLGPNSVTLTSRKGGLNNNAFDAGDAPSHVRVAFNPNTNTMIIVPTALLGNDTYRYSLQNMKATNGDPLTHPGGTLPVTDTFVLNIPAPAPHAVSATAGFASLSQTAWGTAGPGAVGGTVGAGVEWALSDKWSVAGEYLYMRLGANSLVLQTAPLGDGCTPGGTPSCQLNVSQSAFSNNVARLKINYKIF